MAGISEWAFPRQSNKYITVLKLYTSDAADKIYKLLDASTVWQYGEPLYANPGTRLNAYIEASNWTPLIKEIHDKLYPSFSPTPFARVHITKYTEHLDGFAYNTNCQRYASLILGPKPRLALIYTDEGWSKVELHAGDVVYFDPRVYFPDFAWERTPAIDLVFKH